MTTTFSSKSVLFLLIVGGILFVGLAYLLSPTPPQVSISSPSLSLDQQIDSEAAAVQQLLTQYQVDVYITNAHSAKHATSADALRCLNNKGNVATFSEYASRNVHLLCWDEKGQTLYDVIIRRINFIVEKFSNPQSELVTAYAPEGIQGANLLEKMNFYLNHLLVTIGGKIVQIHFDPGEVMFIPK